MIITRDCVRDSIDGELNRINVTNDYQEILNLSIYLLHNIQLYINMNKERVKGVDKND